MTTPHFKNPEYGPFPHLLTTVRLRYFPSHPNHNFLHPLLGGWDTMHTYPKAVSGVPEFPVGNIQEILKPPT